MTDLTIGSYPGLGQAAKPFFRIALGAPQDQGARLVSFAGADDCRDLDALLIHFPDKVIAGSRGRLSHARGIAHFPSRLARGTRRCKPVWRVDDIQPPKLHFRRRLLWPPLVRGLVRLADGWLTLNYGDLTPKELRRARRISPQDPLDLSPLTPESAAALAFLASPGEARPVSGPGAGADPDRRGSALA